MKKFKLTKIFEYYILYQIPLLTDIRALYVAKGGLNNIRKKKINIKLCIFESFLGESKQF